MPSSQTTKETRYWREKAEILVKPFVDAVNAIAADIPHGIAAVAAIDAFGEQEDELIVLEGKYSDCKSYEVERGKEIKELRLPQVKRQQLIGCQPSRIYSPFSTMKMNH